MLYNNCWAIRLIAAVQLQLIFMSDIQPVPSPQKAFGGLRPPIKVPSPLKMKYENYKLVESGKQKTHCNHNAA